jgi:anti-anti-sigma factor
LDHCQELLGLSIESLTLDLARVTFIDSSAVSALIETRRCAIEKGVALRLVSLPAQARQVLEVTGVIDMFDVSGDAAT